MPMLPQKRAFLPACLALTSLLCPLTAPAAPAPPPAASETAWQKVPLQHVLPSQILKAMKWDVAADLPPGVTRIYALQSDNALVIQATPDGFSRVRDVIKILDIEPRPVKVAMVLARATTADLSASGIKIGLSPSSSTPPTLMGAASGKEVARFLQTLQQQGAVLQAPLVSTSNNVKASITISDSPPGTAASGLESFTFAVTPRVNSDDSVNLALDPKATWRAAAKNNGGAPATTQEFQALYTVQNGDTLLIANLFPGAAGASGMLLLFVTPTVAPVK